MHQIPGLKKKVYLTMTLLIVIFLFAVNSKYDVIQCNLHRDYKSINDRSFISLIFDNHSSPLLIILKTLF